MPDTFSIKLLAGADGLAKAWETARVITTTIEHVHPEGRSFREQPWELSFDGRRWARGTAKELQVLAAGMGLEEGFAVYWTYNTTGLQWAITMYFWEEERVSIDVSAYAGQDRMATEEAARLVVKRAAERGVALKQYETRISSYEGPPRTSATDIIINRKPMRKWAMFRAWVGPHMASYVVGVLASVTAAGLIVILGLSG